MAQHVQDPAVFERRLRPIYDNLEVGNNRKALQETEKLLKKQPNLLCARALKGLALLRLGRCEESHSILQAVAEEKPIEDSTLQVLSFCYKEMEQLDKIVELYRHAVTQWPGNEELLAHLFISHVRVEDFKAQQSVALQLYKAQPKNAYYFWAVMSVVLQGVRGPESSNASKRKIYLALAQRLVDKLIAEDKLDAEQEVHLYLHILRLQQKHKEALDFLDGEVCEQHFPGAPVSIRIDLLKQLGMWSELNALLRELLSNENDRWDYYQDYIGSCFELLQRQQSDLNAGSGDATPPSSTLIDDAEGGKCPDAGGETAGGESPPLAAMGILEECHEFLCLQIETAVKKVRGPYMARLELHRRMSAQQMDAVSLLGDFTELIGEYFRMFGDKSCCTHDITLFLDAIPLPERRELASRALLASGISATTLPQNKEQMQKHICALQVSRICGSHIDLEVEHLLAFYTVLKLHFEHGRSSFGQDILPTDMGPSDPYALLAANVMYDVSVREGKSDRLFEALCLLQYVLRNSTSNFHVKLLSLKIYHVFGCTAGAHDMYDYLDIKHIQLDSMGYAHCALLPLSGRFPMARAVFDVTLKFFTGSYKERLEYIALAYRFCTFSKLEEFMNFKERLTNSLHYVATSVEAQLCDLVMLFGTVQHNLSVYAAMCVEPAEDRIAWQELSDNRDLSAIVRWDPVHLIDVDAERRDSFEQEVEVLRIRSLLLRLVSSFVDLFHPALVTRAIFKTPPAATAKGAAGEKDAAGEAGAAPKTETSTVEQLRADWSQLFVRLRARNYEPLSSRFLVNLLPTRLHLLLDQVPYERFFADLAQLALDLYGGATNLAGQCKTVSDNVSALAKLCTDVIKASDEANEDGLRWRRLWQNKVAAVVEILSLYAFVLSMFHEKMQTSAKSKTRQRKGGDTASGGGSEPAIVSEKERSQLLVELMRHLAIELHKCEAAIQKWKSPVLPRDLNAFMSDMSLKQEVEAVLISDVAAIFRESHEMMVADLQNVIKDKIRMLSK